MSMRAATQPRAKNSGNANSHQSSNSMTQAGPKRSSGALLAQRACAIVRANFALQAADLATLTEQGRERPDEAESDTDGEEQQHDQHQGYMPVQVKKEAHRHRVAVLDRKTEQQRKYQQCWNPQHDSHVALAQS